MLEHCVVFGSCVRSARSAHVLHMDLSPLPHEFSDQMHGLWYRPLMVTV